MTKIATLLGVPRSPVSIKESKLFVSSRRVGVELEYENLKQDPSYILDNDLWEVTEDGSLRVLGDGTVSREIRYRQPMGGLDSQRALISLKKLLLRDKGIVCSSRTGLHVHVDFRDATVPQIRNFLITYLMVEPFLYDYCSEGRDKNIFCIPLYRSPHLISSVLNMGTFSYENKASRTLGGMQKYSGVNFGSLSKKGSVEFRMHPSSTDVEAITIWINILLSMVENGLSAKINLKKFLRALDRGYDFLGSTFGKYAEKFRGLNTERNIEIGKESIYAFMCSENSRISARFLADAGKSSIKETPVESSEELIISDTWGISASQISPVVPSTTGLQAAAQRIYGSATTRRADTLSIFRTGSPAGEEEDSNL